MILFLSLNTKDDIVNNVDNQTVDNRHLGEGGGEYWDLWVKNDRI